MKYNGTLIDTSYTLGTSFTLAQGGASDVYLMECSDASNLLASSTTTGYYIMGKKGDTLTSIKIGDVSGSVSAAIDCDYLLFGTQNGSGRMPAVTFTIS